MAANVHRFAPAVNVVVPFVVWCVKLPYMVIAMLLTVCEPLMIRFFTTLPEVKA